MFKKWFDSGFQELKKARPIADKIDQLADQMKQMSDEDLRNKTTEFKQRYQKGETLEDLMVEAYAVVREASVRVLGLYPYYVQLLGAITIHGGNIAEMKTGEGKTLTAVMPAYLNALNGMGVHIVTVNEYLASREANGEIGDLFRFLGMSVGLNIRALTSEEKKEAYACDILYSTNSELGFDYLRDHMVLYEKDMVQKRGLQYAIIDEVDSILIDEARTPLIISGGAKNTQNLYQGADRFAKYLSDEDYLIDIESKTIELSESGITKAEKTFNLDNLYDIANVTLVHHINNALRANFIMFRDKDYMVVENQVLIIDQFTGRVLPGRQFSEGLHQALEAKENVEIKKETITVATITYQNFFRMYKKLSGMTGTAKTEEEEFREIYNMYVVEVPTNRPVIREDAPDYLFVTLEEKYSALIDDVERRHKLGQPILLGTVAVETSEILSDLLRKRRIPHDVLNAKQHEREADIILKAGLQSAVTIATNMAGRGTDIKLGEGVKELGGLAVIGSERHESRRIDNQLRGRSGRQGDPGYSRFYLSAEDELLQRFGGETFKNRIQMISNLNKDKDTNQVQPLESKMFSKFVSSAQKRIEGQNYDSRKSVLKYDDVLRKQREVMYQERTFVITSEDIEPFVLKAIENHIEEALMPFIKNVGKGKFEINDQGILNHFNGNLFQPGTIDIDKLESLDEKTIPEYLNELAQNEIKFKKESFPEEVFKEFLKVISLRVIDTYWTRHIDQMSELRQAVSLQSYGQGNPLQTYQQEGFHKFNEMKSNISRDIAKYVLLAQIRVNNEREAVVKNTSTNEGGELRNKKPKVRQNRQQRNMPNWKRR
ncbi:Protein translocase subunit SecA [Paracholeplasma brassicae]|uniref:Protein translocase subunit SecA n=1 Tax=Acholeplasma brassicae TaxID=61635 RepID=U4KMZ5_9MOLU|nr:preprotein translocase subunit SecA [Paracholeplasma brassicae]CCV65642.1 Protein translocase subunit SecA [Paracholeplasma brassicae]